MAVQQGYGKSAGANSLVFAYDTTDTRNSFKGAPTVNLYGDINTSSAIRPARTEYTTDNWTASFPAPPEKIGRVYKHESGALSSTWSGNSYGYTLKGYTYLANITYTLSCWVYVSPDCNITALHNSMEGTTLTDTANRYYNLNNKGTWQQIVLKCNSSTSISGNAIPVYPSRSGVTDGSFSGFYAWGGAKLEALSYLTPYTVGTRSNEQSILDLTGNSEISVSDVSFNSAGEIVFDGSNDKIHGISLKHDHLDSSAIEFVVTPETKNIRMTVGGYRHNQGYSSPTIGMIYIDSDNRFKASVITAAEVYRYVESTTRVAPNQTYHVVLNKDTTTGLMQLFVNGVLENSATFDAATYAQWSSAGSYIGSDNFDIGKSYNTDSGQGWGADFLQGTISVCKVYNKTLTSTEVASNYKVYRKRFTGLDNYYDNTTDGGRWIRFWWYTGVGWPGHETEALGHPFGTFDSSSHYGFQRLPEGLNKDDVELLAKDDSGNVYKWDFGSTSETAQRVWDSMTQGTQGTWANRGAWNPTVIAGSFHNGTQDTWQYRVSEGVASFLLDDDSCDCISTLNAGHAMCGGSWNQTYAQPDGAYLRYGVDTLNDGGCLGPLPTRQLELFYRIK